MCFVELSRVFAERQSTREFLAECRKTAESWSDVKALEKEASELSEKLLQLHRKGMVSCAE